LVTPIASASGSTRTASGPPAARTSVASAIQRSRGVFVAATFHTLPYGNGATSLDPAASSGPTAALFAIRWRIGELLGWDDDGNGIGTRVPSLRERLPAELREGPLPPGFEGLPFSPLFMTGDEFAAEIANGTMHGVLHLGWVPDGDAYRGEMAVYVKPNGRVGRLYMAAIKPFRYGMVYPRMLAGIGRRWRSPERGR
jgi:hypothetical protein